MLRMRARSKCRRWTRLAQAIGAVTVSRQTVLAIGVSGCRITASHIAMSVTSIGSMTESLKTYIQPAIMPGDSNVRNRPRCQARPNVRHRSDSRRCEERSDEAIQGCAQNAGLLRSARNDAGGWANRGGLERLSLAPGADDDGTGGRILDHPSRPLAPGTVHGARTLDRRQLGCGSTGAARLRRQGQLQPTGSVGVQRLESLAARKLGSAGQTQRGVLLLDDQADMAVLLR